MALLLPHYRCLNIVSVGGIPAVLLAQRHVFTTSLPTSSPCLYECYLVTAMHCTALQE
jgi:hypothetical protein